MKPVISIHNCQTLLLKSLLGNFCSCFDNSNGQFYIQYAESRLQNIELKLDELKTIETLILTQDTRRHSLPGKIRIRRDFTLYLREIYSIMTQDTRKQTLTIPGKIRLVRDFTLYMRQFSPTKIKWNGDLALIIKANCFKKFTLSHWTPNDGRGEGGISSLYGGNLSSFLKR